MKCNSLKFKFKILNVDGFVIYNFFIVDFVTSLHSSLKIFQIKLKSG